MFGKWKMKLRFRIIRWLRVAESIDTIKLKADVLLLQNNVCGLLAGAKSKATVANTRALSEKISNINKNTESLSKGFVRLSEDIERLKKTEEWASISRSEEVIKSVQALRDAVYTEINRSQRIRSEWTNVMNQHLLRFDQLAALEEETNKRTRKRKGEA